MSFIAEKEKLLLFMTEMGCILLLIIEKSNK